MIRQSARYYGAVLSYIVECSGGPVRFRRAFDDAAGFYILDERIPMFIKYSTQRHSPWGFTFQKHHQRRQQSLYDVLGECLMVFVCGRDGIAALSHEDFRTVLDTVFEPQESVTVRRRHSEMYQISGRDGALERRVSRSSLAELLQRPAGRRP